MGAIFGKYPVSTENSQVFPIRNFDQIHREVPIENTKFLFADPKKFQSKFHYPAKEPAKDY